MMFTAKTNLNLPALPEEIEKGICRTAHNLQKPFLMYEAGDGLFECRDIDVPVLYWAVRNLPVSLRSVCIQTIRSGDFDVHVDGPTANGPPREFNLMYVIEPGGDCVTTSFYKTDSELLKLAGPNLVLPEQHREKIATYEFKPRQWVIMNNQCFHSVNGITGLRVGLSISLYRKDFTPFLKDVVDN